MVESTRVQQPEEESAARERHIPPVATQTQHAQAARANPQQRASANMGKPGVAATPRPGDFNDRGAVPAKEAGAPYTPANRGGNQGETPLNPARPSILATFRPWHGALQIRATRSWTRSTSSSRKKQIAKQQQERDKLQQKQDQEHVKLDKQKANDATKAAGGAEAPATDAAVAAKTSATVTAIAAKTAASEPGTGQEVRSSSDGKALIVHGTGIR